MHASYEIHHASSFGWDSNDYSWSPDSQWPWKHSFLGGRPELLESTKAQVLRKIWVANVPSFAGPEGLDDWLDRQPRSLFLKMVKSPYQAYSRI